MNTSRNYTPQEIAQQLMEYYGIKEMNPPKRQTKRNLGARIEREIKKVYPDHEQWRDTAQDDKRCAWSIPEADAEKIKNLPGVIDYIVNLKCRDEEARELKADAAREKAKRDKRAADEAAFWASWDGNPEAVAADHTEDVPGSLLEEAYRDNLMKALVAAVVGDDEFDFESFKAKSDERERIRWAMDGLGDAALESDIKRRKLLEKELSDLRNFTRS